MPIRQWGVSTARPRPPSREAWRGMAIGASAAFAAALIRGALVPLIGYELPFLTFFPAVAVGAWAGALPGGLSALVFSTALAGFFFVEPVSAFQINNLLTLAFFVVGGGIITALGWQFDKSRRAAREAQTAAEAARDRAAFIARASALLGEQMERDATITALTRLAVPSFADWCAIDLFDADLNFIDAKIAAPDDDIVRTALELRRRYPYTKDAQMGIAAVARTGNPEVVLDLPPAFYDVVADTELRDLLVRLDLRSFISVPLTTPDGRRLGVLTTVMSVSQRKFTSDDVETVVDLGRRVGTALDHAALLDETRSRRDELDVVIQSIADPVLLGGPDGRVTLENAAAVAALGDVRGRLLDELLTELPTADEGREIRMLANGTYVLPATFVTAAAGPSVRFAVLRDVTAVLESEAARDAFLGMLSHELRTPITTIFGTAQVLRRPLGKEARASLIDGLAIESDRLYRLVEDLLVLSRFERGRLLISAEPLLIGRVIAGAMQRSRDTYPDVEIALSVRTNLPPVLADPTYVEQILRNLTSNAVKYAGPNARISIGAETVDDIVAVTFEDDGPGVPAAESERVFALYERLGNAAFKPGAGIGLFVCRRLVEAMGGQIGVDRGPTGGARFRFTLPILVDELLVPSSRDGRDNAQAREPDEAAAAA